MVLYDSLGSGPQVVTVAARRTPGRAGCCQAALEKQGRDTCSCCTLGFSSGWPGRLWGATLFVFSPVVLGPSGFLRVVLGPALPHFLLGHNFTLFLESGPGARMW